MPLQLILSFLDTYGSVRCAIGLAVFLTGPVFVMLYLSLFWLQATKHDKLCWFSWLPSGPGNKSEPTSGASSFGDYCLGKCKTATSFYPVRLCVSYLDHGAWVAVFNVLETFRSQNSVMPVT